MLAPYKCVTSFSPLLNYKAKVRFFTSNLRNSTRLELFTDLSEDEERWEPAFRFEECLANITTWTSSIFNDIQACSGFGLQLSKRSSFSLFPTKKKVILNPCGRAEQKSDQVIKAEQP